MLQRAITAKCCSWISLSMEQNYPRLGGIPLLQLCKCVFVFTPRFAQETQHCFYLGSQLEDAACCLLSSPAQGPGDS